MPAAKALDKRWLSRELDRDNRRKARERLAELRVALRDAREARKSAMRQAKERCRSERLAARERARALRLRGLAELREAARLEREASRQACTVSKSAARKKDDVERRRAELAAEAKYQSDLRRIERSSASRRREHRHATYVERRAESDDEVRANIPQDLLPLFERVRRVIKGTPRMSRTEAFLQYAEEHPDEVLDLIDDRTNALIRELEQRQRAATRTSSIRASKSQKARYQDHSVPATPF